MQKKHQQFLRSLCQFILISGFHSYVFAASPVMLNGSEKEIPLERHLSILEDQDGTLTIDDVMSEEISQQFVLNKKDRINMGFTKLAIWARFTIQNQSSVTQKWLLELANPRMQDIRFYLFESNRLLRESQAGSNQNFEQREINYRHNVFQLDLNPNQKITVYLRTQTETSHFLPLTLWSVIGFSEKVIPESYGMGWVYGILAVMLLYNLFLFFSIKDINYFYYIFYLTSFLLYLSMIDGYGFQFIWPDSPNWNHKGILYVGGFLILGILLFARNFIQTPKYLPRLNVIISIEIFLTIVALGVMVWVDYHVSAQYISILAILMAPTMLLAGVLSWKNGYAPARLYTIAWIFFLISVVPYVLSGFAIVERSFVTIYSLRLGAVVELVLLSLTLASRVNLLKQDKEDAQLQTLEAQRILTEELEKQVAERTQQLNETNKELTKKNEIIIEDLMLAERIQKHLFTDFNCPPYLKITTKFLPLSHVSGDIYKIYPYEKGTCNLFLGDSTGHGVAAALSTVMANVILLEERNASLEQIMEHLNDVFERNLPDENFMSAVLININQHGAMRAISAGHPPLILVRANGDDPIILQGEGILLGIIPKSLYKIHETKYTLMPGDKGLLYSDGIFERTNEKGEMFGIDKLILFLKENKTSDLDLLLSQLLEHVSSYSEGKKADDDVTLVAFEYIQS